MHCKAVSHSSFIPLQTLCQRKFHFIMSPNWHKVLPSSHFGLSLLHHMLTVSLSPRKRTSPAKDEHKAGVKDSLLAHSSDPVEMRRLNYQTQGMETHKHTHKHTHVPQFVVMWLELFWVPMVPVLLVEPVSPKPLHSSNKREATLCKFPVLSILTVNTNPKPPG